VGRLSYKLGVENSCREIVSLQLGSARLSLLLRAPRGLDSAEWATGDGEDDRALFVKLQRGREQSALLQAANPASQRALCVRCLLLTSSPFQHNTMPQVSIWARPYN
jgi:hypothetical protein